MRYTLGRAVTFRGIGLHGGQPATVRVAPAAAGQGILFHRTDAPAGTGRIEARFDMVADTRLCTRLANRRGVSVGTVEHLMAALAGSGIDDATVAIDGPEVPIMDGSARAFVEGFAEAGVVAQPGERRAIRLLRTVGVEKDGKRAALEPYDGFALGFAIDFADPAIGRQDVTLDLSGNAFAEELADCRTFGHLAEVEQLRRIGLALGGSLENAIVVDRGRVLNVDGLRRADEFVRHKALDAIGDLALAGAPLLACFVGDKAGHEMTNLLLHALFAQPDAWEWAPAPAAAMRLSATRPLAAEERRLAV
ncbi:MAG: UDP-3-O-acyl-N-acetylglucosamine deacetylase [Paracoccaceae bacterium]